MTTTPKRCGSTRPSFSAREDGAWRLTGLDPDGLDLACGDATLRLPFAERVTSAEQLRKAVVDLAAKARSQLGAAPKRAGEPGLPHSRS